MDARAYGLPELVACPFCEQRDTELHSPFGTALSVATYWCRRCHTAFEWVKWGREDEAARQGNRQELTDTDNSDGPESSEGGATSRARG